MLFPDIDVAAGTVTFALWQPIILVALLVLLVLLAVYRSRWVEAVPRAAGPVVRAGLILFAVAAAWTLLERMTERDRADERRALDRRVAELSARATAPGSPLGCLEANLSEPILFACEKAIFAGAETVAAATAYVTASLALLSDGSATGVDADYDAALAALRRRLEIDRFGFLAQVLAGEGCSAASCEKFALFADTSRIGAHLKARTLENLIARYSASWPQPALTAAPGAPAAPAAPAAAAAPPAPVAAAPAAPGGAPHAGNAINFPSAASIPPVSIMIEEPSHPASTGGIAPAVGAQKRPPGPSRLPPAPARAQAPPAAPAAPAAPIQIGPPAVNGGSEPPPQ